ncbi:MAG: pyridoxine 5'-phosphate synthase [Alphaproteobacteria bacterium]|nr:pyridoxine 5'-phosphate synthase [Alphaproteobacteria bacterium]|tara:strand:- start:364 stop:1098 length:735 start_codon:yes stop_codon:yes gene_type:complete
MKRPRLGVNIDHVATVRNARGGSAPDPVRAAVISKGAGADGITAHLREDRRHIKDDDIQRLMAEVDLPLNFEMAATEEMKDIAINLKPNAVCIVPENRMEITTEGGLDVIGQFKRLKSFCGELNDKGLRTSLFIEPDTNQIDKVVQLGVPVIELHAGSYCDADGSKKKEEFLRIKKAVKYAHDLGLECHVGHGLNYENVGWVASIDHVAELNIGHFLIGESIFLGLESAIRKMKNIIDEAANIK